jgi:hypothetical protein
VCRGASTRLRATRRNRSSTSCGPPLNVDHASGPGWTSSRLPAGATTPALAPVRCRQGLRGLLGQRQGADAASGRAVASDDGLVEVDVDDEAVASLDDGRSRNGSGGSRSLSRKCRALSLPSAFMVLGSQVMSPPKASVLAGTALGLRPGRTRWDFAARRRDRRCCRGRVPGRRTPG